MDTIVFVDIPDPDNVLMVVQVLRDFPDRHIAIVLSPRPVDFSAARYGEDFLSVRKAVAAALDSTNGKDIMDKLITPQRQDTLAWTAKLDPSFQKWFYPDATFFSGDTVKVKEDTRLYMRVSALRFAATLHSEGFSRDRFTIYWDEASMNHIRLAIRHALHVPDYKFYFNDEESRLYTNATTIPSGDERRRTLRDLCEQHAARVASELRYESEHEVLDKFHDLIKTNEQNQTSAELIIGGPLTEPLAYVCCKAPQPTNITFMGGFIGGKNNLFNNQFNFHIDMNSAVRFLDWAKTKSAKSSAGSQPRAAGPLLKLVPTECVKGSPYQLDDTELKHVLGESLALYNAVLQYARESGSGPHNGYVLFDWVAALAVENRELFRWEKVKYRFDFPSKKILFEKSERGMFEMAWDDEEHMKEHKGLLLEKMKGNKLLGTDIPREGS